MVVCLNRYYRVNRSFAVVLTFFGVLCLLTYTKLVLKDPRISKNENELDQYHTNIFQDHFNDHMVDLSLFGTISQGSWQKVNGPEFKFLVFSAYYDKRNNPLIRIIAVTKTKKKRNLKIWCKYWYSNNFSEVVEGQLKIIKENWGLLYSAHYIICPLNNLKMPLAVSVVADPKDYPSNILKVVDNLGKNRWDSNSMGSFGVCVKPLHYEYNKEIELMEFIELHRLMGVDHFTFYNHSVGAQVDCVLNRYINDGVVTVLPWDLPIVSQKEIRTEGIFAALNDCLYRNMYKYTHVVFIDLDEYIVPTEDYTLPDLMSHLNQPQTSSNNGAFLFQNAFFYLQWDDDDEVRKLGNPLSKHLITLRKTRRKTALHRHRTRSKYICRPEMVNEVGNHFIWEFSQKKFVAVKVRPEDAILHHYRVCEFGGDDCVTAPSMVDKTVYKYKNDLISTVDALYKELKFKCNLQDLDI